MDLSEEDSFGWCDDPEDNGSDTDCMVKPQNYKLQIDDSESGKNFKKKLQKELFVDSEQNYTEDLPRKKKNHMKIKEESVDSDSPKTKRIKIEPSSDTESRKKKKKSKHREYVNDKLNSLDSESQDDSFLNHKVKEELETELKASKTKTKKKKHRRDSDTILSSATQFEDADIVKNKRKKKKKSTNKDKSKVNYECNENVTNETGCELSDGNNARFKKYSKDSNYTGDSENEMTIEDKFSAEENSVTEYYQEKLSSDLNININGELNVTNTPLNKTLPERGVDSSKSEEVDSSRTSLNNSHNLPDKTRRPLKISDRIQFEDENNSEVDTQPDNYISDWKPSKLLSRYIKANPNWKPLQTHIGTNSVITSDDEIWLLKCPTEINIQALKGVDLNLDGKCKIKMNSQTYEGALAKNSAKLTLLASEKKQFVIKNVQSDRTVQFRKRIPKVHYPEDNIMVNNQTNFIPLPETKQRHPLFGPNYRKAIKIPAPVAERLSGIDTKGNSSIVKRPKKRKRERDEQECLQSTEADERRAKKRRSDRASDAVWGSEQDIERQLFNF